MQNILVVLFKGLMGMKFGWVILLVGGIILGLSFIKNIFNGTFGIAKFASGFNIFSGSTQGKLIYYAIIITACLAFYGKIMQPTTSFDTDYKNNIKGNQDVLVDQRVGATCIPTKILWGVIQFGCKSEPMNKVVNNNECFCQQKGKK